MSFEKTNSKTYGTLCSETSCYSLCDLVRKLLFTVILFGMKCCRMCKLLFYTNLAHVILGYITSTTLSGHKKKHNIQIGLD